MTALACCLFGALHYRYNHNISTWKKLHTKHNMIYQTHCIEERTKFSKSPEQLLVVIFFLMEHNICEHII